MKQHSLINFNIDSTIQYTQEIQMTNGASQLSPPKGIEPQNHVTATEQPRESPTGNEPVPFHSCSNSNLTDLQESGKLRTTTFTGDTTIPPLMIKTPLIEEKLMRNQQTNELYLSINSTVVLKRKQGMLYVTPHSENNLTLDALVASGAYVSTTAQNDLVTIKQKSPNKLLKIDNPPDFEIQVANGQLEKSLASTTLKFEN